MMGTQQLNAAQSTSRESQWVDYYIKYFTDRGYPPVQVKQFLLNKGLSKQSQWLTFYAKYYTDKGYPAVQVKQFLISNGFDPTEVDAELRRTGKM
jgi:uncharacterized alpha/beta hydrolase family protein